MPLFEFRCSDCGKKTEELVLAGDKARTPKCPSCGSKRMARLLSTFAAQTSRPAGAKAFDPATACGGGACAMPDVCGAGGDDFDVN